ncbi:MAG: hypothetical protein PHR20_02550 [Bacteroidales bacterium]|nr:hypothetical protein [Bacteroidales bacterium]
MKTATSKILLLSILLTVSGATLSAENIRIDCVFSNGTGRTFCLNKTKDYLTNEQEVLYSTIIDKTQKISFTFETAITTEEYFISVDYYSAPICLTEGESYRLSIACPEYVPNRNPFSGEQSLELYILSSDTINKEIDNFNDRYDSFLLKNIHVISKISLSAHNAFRDKELKQLENCRNTFLVSYIEYSMAVTDFSLIRDDYSDFLSRYFIGRPVLYNNPMYMTLFKESAYLMEPFLTDSSFTDYRLKELIYIYVLKSDYFNADYEKSAVTALLKSFAIKARYKESRMLSSDLAAYLTALSKGSVLPDIGIIDEAGTDISKSIDGNRYLFFFKSDLDLCLSTLAELKAFDWNSYTISPIYISLDTESTYSAKTGVCHTYNLMDTHRMLRIYQFPFAIIINADGTIYKYNAPYTAEGLEIYLKKEKFTRL